MYWNGSPLPFLKVRITIFEVFNQLYLKSAELHLFWDSKHFMTTLFEIECDQDNLSALPNYVKYTGIWQKVQGVYKVFERVENLMEKSIISHLAASLDIVIEVI